uniref:CYTB_CTER domain-containing protein n=1 Tax=Heterorhabditis bacteriophora TaxID=37862 RepID=A0A1I7X5D8_HETBA
MAILYFVTALLFFVIVVFMLHIPLPPTIADRKKLQFFEFFMRLGNIYGTTIKVFKAT